MRLQTNTLVTFGAADGYAANNFSPSSKRPPAKSAWWAAKHVRSLYCFKRRACPNRLPLPRDTEFGWGWNQWMVADRFEDWWVPSRTGLFPL